MPQTYCRFPPFLETYTRRFGDHGDAGVITLFAVALSLHACILESGKKKYKGRGSSVFLVTIQ